MKVSGQVLSLREVYPLLRDFVKFQRQVRSCLLLENLEPKIRTVSKAGLFTAASQLYGVKSAERIKFGLLISTSGLFGSSVKTLPAFPTTSVVDDFNRANQYPPGAGWLGSSVAGGMQVLDNQLANPSGEWDGIYWNRAATLDDDIFITLVELATGESSFTPADISGLNGWYDASLLGLADEAAVTTWPDLSGQGRTLTGQAVFQTNVLNGLPVVRFDGVDDFFDAASPSTFGQAFVVCQYAGATFKNYDGLISSADPGYGYGLILTANSGTTSFYPYSIDASYVDGVSFPPGSIPGPMNQAKVYSISRNALWGADSTQHWSGSQIAGRNWLGDIAEVISYDHVPSATERQQVEAYLGQKWLGAAGSGAGAIRFHLRRDTAADTAYVAELANGNALKLVKRISGVDTELASVAEQYAAGDGIGFRVNGNNLVLYRRVGGTWEQKLAATDSAIASPGVAAIYIQGEDWRLDDFGGPSREPIIHQKTGSLISGTSCTGSRMAERSEAGLVAADNTFAAIDVRESLKAGSLAMRGLSSAVRLREIVETG